MHLQLRSLPRRFLPPRSQPLLSQWLRKPPLLVWRQWRPRSLQLQRYLSPQREQWPHLMYHLRWGHLQEQRRRLQSR